MQDRIPSKPRITLHRHVKYALVNAKLPTDSLQIYHNVPTHQRRGRGEYWLSGNDVANLQERIKNSEEEAELLHAKSRNWRSLNANGSRELYASTMNVVDRTERKTRDSTGLFKAKSWTAQRRVPQFLADNADMLKYEVHRCRTWLCKKKDFKLISVPVFIHFWQIRSQYFGLISEMMRSPMAGMKLPPQ